MILGTTKGFAQFQGSVDRAEPDILGKLCVPKLQPLVQGANLLGVILGNRDICDAKCDNTENAGPQKATQQ